jgi:hypothetical protein
MRVSRVIAAFIIVATPAACGSSNKPAPPTEPTPQTSQPPPTPPTIPAGLSPTLTSMLDGLSQYIGQALTQSQGDLPRNPQNRTQIEAKIAMLQNPSLAADIVNGRRWFEGQSTSMNGRTVPVVTVFALESMRNEATDAIHALEPVLPIIERFYDVPLSTAAIRVWYGFVIGNSGGGGVIYTEDRTTYEARTGPTRLLPYDAIWAHELGHSWMGHEGFNQFIELYGYNVVRTGSTNPAAWTFTRNWTPNLVTNEGVAALLDIYQLIGHDTMQRAYRAIYPLRPPYGTPPSPAVIQAFLSAVPPTFQAQVSAKLAKVTF